LILTEAQHRRYSHMPPIPCDSEINFKACAVIRWTQTVSQDVACEPEHTSVTVQVQRMPWR